MITDADEHQSEMKSICQGCRHILLESSTRSDIVPILVNMPATLEIVLAERLARIDRHWWSI